VTGFTGSIAAVIYQRAQLERLSADYLQSLRTLGLVHGSEGLKMDPLTLLLSCLCACSFVALLPAFSDGIKLVRRVTREAATRRQRKKRISSRY
jgi:hypothetical protein